VSLLILPPFDWTREGASPKSASAEYTLERLLGRITTEIEILKEDLTSQGKKLSLPPAAFMQRANEGRRRHDRRHALYLIERSKRTMLSILPDRNRYYAAVMVRGPNDVHLHLGLKFLLSQISETVCGQMLAHRLLCKRRKHAISPASDRP
jgi:hypothetical protein